MEIYILIFVIIVTSGIAVLATDKYNKAKRNLSRTFSALNNSKKEVKELFDSLNLCSKRKDQQSVEINRLNNEIIVLKKTQRYIHRCPKCKKYIKKGYKGTKCPHCDTNL